MLRKLNPMDDVEGKVSQEELDEEKAALVLPKEEDIRAEIISEFGFDETADAEKIETAVKREMNQRTITSKAIKAKIDHRTTAEGLRKKVPPEQKAPVQESKKEEKPVLSTPDLYALIGAKVPEEDVEEVQKAAKLLGVSIAEALKDDVLKGVLARRLEQRNSANASNTNTSRKGNAKKSDADILKEASDGKIPDAGTPEAQQLFDARRARGRK